MHWWWTVEQGLRKLVGRGSRIPVKVVDWWRRTLVHQWTVGEGTLIHQSTVGERSLTLVASERRSLLHWWPVGEMPLKFLVNE